MPQLNKKLNQATDNPNSLNDPKPKNNANLQKPFTLRIITYNIHSCVNVYGRFDAEAVARVIAESRADIVALQEVTISSHLGGMDQSRFIADYLNMNYYFLPLRTLSNGNSGHFGLAVLSRYPLTLLKKDVLSDANRNPLREPRGAMWMEVDTPAGPVNIINTHLSLYRRDRLAQAAELLGPQWLGMIENGRPAILCGDLNAGSYSPIYRSMRARLTDVQQAVKQKGYPKATFFSFYPILRLDHIFVSHHLETLSVNVPTDPSSKRASDHLPLIAELGLS